MPTWNGEEPALVRTVAAVSSVEADDGRGVGGQFDVYVAEEEEEEEMGVCGLGGCVAAVLSHESVPTITTIFTCRITTKQR